MDVLVYNICMHLTYNFLGIGDGISSHQPQQAAAASSTDMDGDDTEIMSEHTTLFSIYISIKLI